MFNDDELKYYERLKLTYQELQNISGFENVKANEANEIIDLVFQLSIISFNTYVDKSLEVK